MPYRILTPRFLFADPNFISQILITGASYSFIILISFIEEQLLLNAAVERILRHWQPIQL